MRTSLELVTEQFPQLRDRVACLFERDEVFRELCDDYATCVRASTQPDPPEDLRREYEGLRLRMEYELLRQLQEHAGRTPPGANGTEG